MQKKSNLYGQNRFLCYNTYMRILFAGMHINAKAREYHTHDAWELIYCTNGSGKFTVKDEESIEYGTGDIIIVAPHTFHSNTSDSSFSNYYLLMENTDILYDKVNIINDSSAGFIPSILKEIYHVFTGNMSNKQEVLFHLGAIISSCVKNINSSIPTSPLINKIKTTIDEKISDIDFNISDLLSATHPSPEYLRKRFKTEIGVTPLQYLLETRLNYAQNLLKIKYDLKLNIAEIALMSGFNDPLYFSRLYKKNFGISPKEQT